MNNLLFLIFFFIHLPPFILFFKQITIYRVAEIILFLLFISSLIKKKLLINKLSKNIKIILGFFLLFFLSQSLSIIYANNLKLFLEKYEIIIFFIFLLFTLVVKIDNKEKVKKSVNFLIYCFLFQAFFELFFFIAPIDLKLNILSLFHPNAAEIISFNISRNRNYLESYFFIVTPLIMFKLAYEKKNYRKLIWLFSILLIFFLSLVSGFKIYFGLIIIAIILSLFFLKKQKNIAFLLFILIPFIFFSYRVLFKNYLFLNKFLISPNEEIYQSVTTRLEMWKKGIEIGFSSPFFGVGLNNYSLYQSDSLTKLKFSLGYQFFKNNTLQVFDDPHNIFISTFSQTGFFGLMAIILMLIYFIKNDLPTIFLESQKGRSRIILLKKIFILSFWLLLIYLFFHPFNTIRSFFYFGFLRIVITKLN